MNEGSGTWNSDGVILYEAPSNGAFDEGGAALSPNGRWLAYTSNESGTYQVIVQPFPNPSGGKVQVSTNGGKNARWRRDGRELYFVDSNGGITAVSVSTEGEFQVGKSTPLFKPPAGTFGTQGNLSAYDVTADGQHFLISVPVASLESARLVPLTVVLNWTSALKQ